MRAATILFLMFLVPLGTAAQKKDATTEVREAYVRFLNASRLADKDALTDIMTDDYSQVLPDGRMRDKATRIRETMEDKGRVMAIDLVEFSARVYGSSAVAVCTVHQEFTDDAGKLVKVDTRSTATLVKNKGKWRVAATHLSPVAAK